MRREADPLKEELSLYRSFPEEDPKSNPYEWWRNYEGKLPRLALLARMYLCLPASSAPSERVFSRLQVTVSKKRARLKAGKVEKMVMISKNRPIINRLPKLSEVMPDAIL